MMIDRITTAGVSAYVPNSVAAAGLNLAGGQGRIGPVGAGKVLRISGIQLSIAASPLVSLLERQASPMVEILIEKELLTGLFDDPYARRIHTVGGYEDFRRGLAEQCAILEVDGVATLVSVGNATASWKSPIFGMPDPTNFVAAAWDLAVAKDLTPADAFAYSIDLAGWYASDAVSGPASASLPIADTRGPADDRHNRSIGFEQDVVAYQLIFRGDVRADSYLRERRVAGESSESIGLPLLRSVSLLEEVDSAFSFHSLAELLLRSSRVHTFDDDAGVAARVTAYLDIPVILTAGESLLVRATDAVDSLYAQLDAEELLRPPADPRL